MARHLIETDINLIQTYIQTNIGAALASISAIHADKAVTLEVPSTQSYFIYQKAHGYQCPAIFIEDDGTDFRQNEKQANFIDALASINVTVKAQDYSMELLTLKSWRYQAAMHQLLDQTPLASADNAVKIYLRVKRIRPSGIYVMEDAQESDAAVFYKEFLLQLEVDHFENF